MILLASEVEIPFLNQIVVILGLSILVIYLFQRMNLPAILGFLATGMIFGPHAIGLARAGDEIAVLSEIGVILLLFIIGLEFSIKSLINIKKIVLLGGFLQVILTIMVTTGVGIILGLDANTAVFMGFLFSLSSTAIVLKMIQEKGLMKAPHGRIALGILIFQDIIVVPMMLLTPILSGNGGNVVFELLFLVFKFAIVILAVYFMARYVVPRLLHEIARTRSRELFLITIIVICFAVAYFTSLMGLSLALGAFMAGLCISESEYSHQATGLIIPFREIFTSFFFVSIGMLFDLGFLIDHFFIILGFTVGVFLLKFTVLVVATKALRYPLSTGLLVGFSMFQVGEFAFILATVGISNGLITDELYQYFLAISIITMAATPFTISYAERFTGKMMASPFGKLELSKLSEQPAYAEDYFESLKNHLIIIGYGINGRNTARTARKAGIPYVVIDMNADAVREARKNGEPIMFGDASNDHILEQVHVHKARVAVVAISNHDATIAIVSNIRLTCKTVHVIARCSTLAQSEELLHAGASESVSEKFETSVEVFARTLNQFLVSTEDIDKYITIVRDDSYRGVHSNFHVYKRDAIPINEMHTVSLLLGSSCPFSDQHLCEAPLLGENRVRVLGIFRNQRYLTKLDGDTMMEAGDQVVLIGRKNDINNFMEDWEERSNLPEAVVKV
jgi:CPA2 family monovalent cation:H+ antiporter-2